MDPERLRAIPLFADLSDPDRERLAAAMAEQSIEIGTVLSRQGDLASRFFAIEDGKAAMTTAEGFVAILSPGDVFGEIGSIGGPRRTANVVAITPMRLLTLMAWDLRQLAEVMPDLASRLEESIDRRLAELRPGLGTT